MGQQYDFHCHSCDYLAEVAGGEDCGMTLATTTILCEDCRELYDVPTSEDSMRRSPEHETPIRCPEFSSHRVRLWKHPGPCPKCGATLKRERETVIWD